MSIEKITKPPFNTPFEDGQGNVSRAWLAWVDSVYKYLNQEQATLTDVDEFTDTPANVSTAATLADLNTLREAVNTIHDRLEVA